MAQTTAGIVQSGFVAEVSAAGSVWTQIGGQAVSVKVSGGEALVGQQLTADGEYAVVVAGHKVEPLRVTVRSLYTASAGEAWALVWAQFIGADKSIYVRWTPKGATNGNLRYATSNDGATRAAARITKCLPPEQDASSGNPALFEFEVMTPALFEDAYA